MCKMKSVKKLVICAVCIALCCVLPIAFHAFNLGVTFSPMHIPVLLCGLLCGGSYGLCCGLVGPLLSSLVSGMPGPMGLVTMVPELMAYGLSAGLLMKVVRTKNTYADTYISLAGAMLIGRVVGGLASYILYTFFVPDGMFTLAVWATSYFVSAAPGIVCHLIVIPILVFTLAKAGLVPPRYLKVTVRKDNE